MVIIYNYGTQILQRQQTNASHSLAILVAMAMSQYSTKRIDLCVMLSASVKATGCRNWSSICSVSPGDRQGPIQAIDSKRMHLTCWQFRWP